MVLVFAQRFLGSQRGKHFMLLQGNIGEKVIGMCNNLFRGYIKTKTSALLVSTLS